MGAVSCISDTVYRHRSPFRLNRYDSHERVGARVSAPLSSAARANARGLQTRARRARTESANQLTARQGAASTLTHHAARLRAARREVEVKP